LSTGALTSLRTDNSPSGAPFGGYGLFWTQDDIAKLSLLLNDQNGSIDGTQILESGLPNINPRFSKTGHILNQNGPGDERLSGLFWLGFILTNLGDPLWLFTDRQRNGLGKHPQAFKPSSNRWYNLVVDTSGSVPSSSDRTFCRSWY